MTSGFSFLAEQEGFELLNSHELCTKEPNLLPIPRKKHLLAPIVILFTSHQREKIREKLPKLTLLFFYWNFPL